MENENPSLNGPCLSRTSCTQEHEKNAAFRLPRMSIKTVVYRDCCLLRIASSIETVVYLGWYLLGRLPSILSIKDRGDYRDCRLFRRTTSLWSTETLVYLGWYRFGRLPTLLFIKDLVVYRFCSLFRMTSSWSSTETVVYWRSCHLSRLSI